MFQEPVLWEHQKIGRERAIKRAKKGFAFFWEPGTGKTLEMICVIRDIFNFDRVFKKVLVMAPIIVLENWKKEFLKFSKVDPKRILPLYGPTKRRIVQLQDAITKYDGRVIVVTNYEALASSKEWALFIENWGPEILVCDESQKLKSHKSVGTKIVTKISEKAQYKYLLSGTPILNSPADLFSQFRIMDSSLFGTNFYAFQSIYFYDKNAGMPKNKYFPDFRIRPKAEEEIRNIISEASMVVKKSECLDLPPFIRKIVEVEMSEEQKKFYKEMKDHLITYMNDEACVAEMALTKSLRLQQIISGYLRTDEGKDISLETPRKEALKELLEEITPASKVLVWCVFKQNYNQVREVCTELGVEYVEAHGDIGPKDKFKAVETFTNVPTCRVFIGHPGSLGIGINLVAASYSIYYSRDFSRENDEQSEARNYRGGSEVHEKITRIDLVCPGTIDEIVLKALENKENISEAILANWREL